MPMGVAPFGLTNCPAAPVAPSKEGQPQPPASAAAPTVGPFAEALQCTLASLLPLTSSLPLSVDACNKVGRSPAHIWEPQCTLILIAILRCDIDPAGATE